MGEKESSIKLKIIYFFSLLMISTLIMVGLGVFSSWKVSSDDMIINMENDAHKDIFTKLEAYLNIPLYVNELSHYSIQNEVVDIYNQQEREIYFAGILKSTNEKVYSFSYGTEKGEYYGARRNKNNEIEIMKSDAETDGKSTYYSLTSDMTSGAIVEQLGKFDPRTRDWYKIAKEKGTPRFSPTYKHFVMDDLAISAAYPIYDKAGELKGVLGTHFILSGINSQLKDIVKDKNATAYIVEKSSGELVANSLEMPNFTTLPDKSFKRLTIEKVDNTVIGEAYQNYKESGKNKFLVNSQDEKFHINIDEYKGNGLNWLIIIAMPESQFTAPIIKGVRTSLFFLVFALIGAIILWIKSINVFLTPIYHLIGVTEKYSQGDFSQRATILKNDEVGKLSKAFNKMAEELYILVNNLEEKVKRRTSDLEKTNIVLIETAERLRITLFSIGDGFISTDKFGNIAMMNGVAEQLTGWCQEEAMGKPFEEVFNIINECTGEKCYSPVKKVHETRDIIELENHTILISKDGRETSIEDSAAPIIDDKGTMIGVVIVFRDCTEKREKQLKIEYLSYHDVLTGLYNRRFYEEELRRLDTARNLPIALVMADVNGLKLVNDAFGHDMGDELLRKVALIMKTACRADEIVARIGGDEFVLLLPKTDLKAANQLMERISTGIMSEKIEPLVLSISMGCAVKKDVLETMDVVFKEAEDDMYRRKLSEGASMRSKNINLIISSLYEKSKREMDHAKRVSEICEAIAIKMKFDKDIVNQIRTAGRMHDIGKIGIEDKLLNKVSKLDNDEWLVIKRHPEIGYRILSSANEFSKIADFVLEHHERWDGKGYPKGIKGEAISIQARIIAIAEAYDAMTAERVYRKALSQEEAVVEIRRHSGSQFDPEIVKVFLGKVLGKSGAEF